MMRFYDIIVFRTLISIRRVPPLVGLALVTHFGISRFYETVNLGDSMATTIFVCSIISYLNILISSLCMHEYRGRLRIEPRMRAQLYFCDLSRI